MFVESCSKEWSHESFERAVGLIISVIKPTWLEELEIAPIEYSEWSDSVYVMVHLKFDKFTYEKITENDFFSQTFYCSFSSYLRTYFKLYLNTNIAIKKWNTVNYGH